MAKKAKKTFTKEHRDKLSAAAKRRHAKNRRDRAAQRAGWGKSDMPALTLAQIEKSIKTAQSKIKKLRAHRTARLKLLRQLNEELAGLRANKTE